MRGAEFVQRFGDLCLLLDGDVLPDLAVRQVDLALDRAVGIDAVAGMQQEVRPVLSHGLEGEHAAFVRVDAPALSCDVAAPDKADIALVRWRGAEAAGNRFA